MDIHSQSTAFQFLLGLSRGNSFTHPKVVKGSRDFFMKDADPQQRNKLLGGMKTAFVNAAKGTCRFHIVNIGWKKHVPPICITNSNLVKWSLVIRKKHRYGFIVG